MEVQTIMGTFHVRTAEEQQAAHGGTPSTDRLYIEWQPNSTGGQVASLTPKQMLDLAAAITQHVRVILRDVVDA